MKLFATVVLALMVGACLAQTPQTASALIEASIANTDVNAKEALTYTFHEDDANFLEGGSNEPPKPTLPGSKWIIPAFMVNAEYRWSVQLDVLFVEGIPYRRVTGINGQRLSPEIAAWESERYDRAVAAIHALSPEQRQQRLNAPQGSASIVLDPKQLTSLYSCKISGHDKIDKRPSTVIKCKPRHDLPRGSTDTQPDGQVTLWVDDSTPFFHRTRMVLDHTVDQYGAGTVVTSAWDLIDGVWHQTSVELDWVGSDSTIKTMGPQNSGAKLSVEEVSRGKEIVTFSNFKKFRIASRIIVPGSAPDAPLAPQN